MKVFSRSPDLHAGVTYSHVRRRNLRATRSRTYWVRKSTTRVNGCMDIASNSLILVCFVSVRRRYSKARRRNPPTIPHAKPTGYERAQRKQIHVQYEYAKQLPYPGMFCICTQALLETASAHPSEQQLGAKRTGYVKSTTLEKNNVNTTLYWCAECFVPVRRCCSNQRRRNPPTNPALAVVVVAAATAATLRATSRALRGRLWTAL